MRKADWLSGSKPDCVVRYNGKRVSKTKVRHDTCDPRWYHLTELEVPIAPDGDEAALPAGETGDALIELWEYDTIGADDFLGQVVLTRDMLLRPHARRVQARAAAEPPARARADGLPRPADRVRTSSAAAQRADGTKGEYAGLEPQAYPRARKELPADANSMAKALAQRRELKLAEDEETERPYWYDPVTRESFWEDPRPKPPPPATTEPMFVLPPPPPKRNESVERYDFSPRRSRPRSSSSSSSARRRPKNVDEGVFVKGISDPYARLRVCGQGRESGKSPVRRVEQAGKFSKKDTTPTKNNTLNPVWDDKNVFRAPMPLNDDSAGIVVELWDDDGLFFSPTPRLRETDATELLNTTGGTLRGRCGRAAATRRLGRGARNVLAKITLRARRARPQEGRPARQGRPYAMPTGRAGRRAGSLGQDQVQHGQAQVEPRLRALGAAAAPGGRVKLEIFDYDAIGADDLLGGVSLFRAAQRRGRRKVKLQDRPAPRAQGQAPRRRSARRPRPPRRARRRARSTCASRARRRSRRSPRSRRAPRRPAPLNELNSLAAVEIDIVREAAGRPLGRLGPVRRRVPPRRAQEREAGEAREEGKAAAQSGRRGCCGQGGGAAGAPEEEEDEAVAPRPRRAAARTRRRRRGLAARGRSTTRSTRSGTRPRPSGSTRCARCSTRTATRRTTASCSRRGTTTRFRTSATSSARRGSNGK